MITTPPAMTALHHVGITVTNIDRSLDWYREMLGMVQWMKETWDGGWTACLVRPDTHVHLGLDVHERNEGEPFAPYRTGLDHISFATASRAEVHAWHTHLTAKGVPCGAITEANDPAPHALFTFVDPDGIALEIIFLEEG